MPHLALRPPPPPVPHRDRVGPYRLLGVLGEGATGRVYLASRLPAGPACALKVSRSGRNDAIIREAAALSVAQHRAVVSLLDSGRAGALPYLVMERLDGLTLEARLRDGGPLDLRALVDLVIPVCDALARMHKLGVIHRDVKPANLFVVRTPYGDSLRLLDFGEAQIPQDALPPNAPAPTEEHHGTPAYLGPEVHDAQAIITPATDQYALGVVLYECVSGRRPFSQGPAAARIYAQTKEEYPPLTRLVPHLPTAFEAVVRRALRPNPVDRFPDLWHLAAALLPFASEAVHATWLPVIALATSDDTHLTAPISRTIVRRAPAVRPTAPPSPAPPPPPAPPVRSPPPLPAVPSAVAVRRRIHGSILAAAGFVATFLVVFASSVSVQALRRPRAPIARPAPLVAKPPAPPAPPPSRPLPVVAPPPAPPAPSPPRVRVQPPARTQRPPPRAAPPAPPPAQSDDGSNIVVEKP